MQGAERSVRVDREELGESETGNSNSRIFGVGCELVVHAYETRGSRSDCQI